MAAIARVRRPAERFAIAALLLSPALLGAAYPRVIGGNSVPPGEFPWMTGVFTTGGASPFCGASLIRPGWLLTAAHCVAGLSPDVLEVIVGLDDLSVGGTALAVQQIVIQPSYDGQTYDGDAALLQLADSSDAPIVREADAEVQASMADGDEVSVLGWGWTSDQPGTGATTLQIASMPYLSTAACNLTGVAPVTQNQICAGLPQGGVDTCNGDSGGPLFAVRAGVPRVVGITSTGDGCALPNLPGVYTEVASYADWIASYAPEPGAGSESLAALAGLAGLARRRRSPRRAFLESSWLAVDSSPTLRTEVGREVGARRRVKPWAVG